MGVPDAVARALPAARAKWRADPIGWMRSWLGGPEPWARQVEIAEAVRDNRETNVHTGNAVGKDWIAARIALWFLLTRKDAIVVTTATKKTQVDKVLWGEIRQAFRQARARAYFGDARLQPVASEIRIAEKWYAIGVTARDTSAFSGFHAPNVLVIEDEAAGLAEFADEAALGLTASPDDRIFRIGNPVCGPTHYFAKACAKGNRPGLARTIRISSRETPNYVAGQNLIPGMATRESVAAWERKYGKGSVMANAHVDGVFPGSAADGLISMEHIAAARQRKLAGVQPEDGAPVRLGCDPARYGDDLTTIYAVRGPFAWECDVMGKADSYQIADALVKHANHLKAMTVAIDSTGGYGAGPIDIFKRRLRNGKVPTVGSVYEVNFGAASSNPDQWANRRTELWWRMRDWIKDEAAWDPDETIEEELLASRFKPHGEGIILQPKEDLKKEENLGRSPDRADALAVAVSGHRMGMLLAGAPPAVKTETAPRPSQMRERHPEDDDEIDGHARERKPWEW